MRKVTRILTGIIALLYFSIPYFFELSNQPLENSSYYAWIFVPEYVFNFFYNLTSSKHVLPFIGLLLAAMVVWICLFYIIMAIYDIYMDIYLNKKRFEEDVEGD
jgi:hypothetical protein